MMYIYNVKVRLRECVCPADPAFRPFYDLFYKDDQLSLLLMTQLETLFLHRIFVFQCHITQKEMFMYKNLDDGLLFDFITGVVSYKLLLIDCSSYLTIFLNTLTVAIFKL